MPGFGIQDIVNLVKIELFYMFEMQMCYAGTQKHHKFYKYGYVYIIFNVQWGCPS